MTPFDKGYLFGYRIGANLRKIFGRSYAEPKQMHGPWPVPAKEFQAWWTRRNWKTQIQDGVIGSRDNYWPLSNPIMPDCATDAGKIVEQCHSIATQLVQRFYCESGKMVQQINATCPVWTGNRYLLVSVEFQVQVAPDDPDKFLLIVTDEQRQKLATTPRAINAFLN